MATEIHKIEDYRDVTVLGLEPSDRQPQDYLRMVARIFNSFREIDINKTVASYITGFRVDVTDIVTQFQFDIIKGMAFVDDQFIAFKDDIRLLVDKGTFVNDIDYWLVLYYQYSEQFPAPVPEFKFITENSYDESTMLKLLKFKVKGQGNGATIETYPQDLDGMYMDNFKKLFKLVENKVFGEADQIRYDYTIQKEELYVDNTQPNLSTKSGDVVFLDNSDLLYKPARACNKEYDKALGIYLYNKLNNEHYIVAAGVFHFNRDKYDIHPDNAMLYNLEAGKSYYLLDGCAETDYPVQYDEVTGKRIPIAGKISTTFFPGTVRVGYALSNDTMVIDIDFSSDMDVFNLLEIMGLPQEFKDRFLHFLRYFEAVSKKGELETLYQDLSIYQQSIIDKRDNLLNNVDSSNLLSTGLKDLQNNVIPQKEFELQNTLFYDDGTVPPSTLTNPKGQQVNNSYYTLAAVDQNALGVAYEELSHAYANQAKKDFGANGIFKRSKLIINDLKTRIPNVIAIVNAAKTTLNTLSNAITNTSNYKYKINSILSSDDFRIRSVVRRELDPTSGTIADIDLNMIAGWTINEFPTINAIDSQSTLDRLTNSTGSGTMVIADSLSSSELTTYSATDSEYHVFTSVINYSNPNPFSQASSIYFDTTSPIIRIDKDSESTYSTNEYSLDENETDIWFSNPYANTVDSSSRVISNLDSIINYYNQILSICTALESAFIPDQNNTYNLDRIVNLANQLNTLITNNTLFNIMYNSSYNSTSSLINNLSDLIYYLNIIDFSNYDTVKDNYISAVLSITNNLYSVDYNAKILHSEVNTNILSYINNIKDIDETSNIETQLNIIKTYLDERVSFVDAKYEDFKIYSELYGKMKSDELKDELMIQQTLKLTEQLTSISDVELVDVSNYINTHDDELIAKIRHEKQVLNLFYLNDYERKIYNYTYLTIRLRLKYKHKTAVLNNLGVIEDTLVQLKSEVIKNIPLIEELEDLKISYNSILDSINKEIRDMVLEYNNLREYEFGIPPIQEGDEYFDDGGFANPNLEYFMHRE